MASPTSPKASKSLLIRLTRDQVAYLRGLAQGIPAERAARQYLALTRSDELAAAHISTLDTARTIARRAGFSAWRLLGMPLRPGLSVQSRLGVDEWAQANGFEDFPADELLILYAEAYPVDANQARLERRAGRLEARRMALLAELDSRAVDSPKRADLIADWFDPSTVAKLEKAGWHRLEALSAAIECGGRWWSVIPGYGRTKAARLAGDMAILGFAPIERPSFDIAFPGRVGASALPCEYGDDDAAVEGFLRARTNSLATRRAYQKEIRRFRLWCAIERGKSFSDVGIDDCVAFLAFLMAVPDTWVGRDKPGGVGRSVAPFKGQLSRKSRALALACLNSLYEWLVAVGYLSINPLAHINKKVVSQSTLAPVPKAFTSEAWEALLSHAEKASGTPAGERFNFLLHFGCATGLRPAEIVAARFADIEMIGDTYWLLVEGKGRKQRRVPLPPMALRALDRYAAVRGVPADWLGLDIPLVPSLRGEGEMSAVSYRALFNSFQAWVRAAQKESALPDRERDDLVRTGLHRLRHTHATRFAEAEGPIDVLQANLGHANLSTTGHYYQAQHKRRSEEMGAVFG